jgi:hypothetical protein
LSAFLNGCHVRSRLCEASDAAGLARKLSERFFDLRGDFQCKGIEALRKVANILQELIIKDYCRDSCDQTCGGGEQGFGDAGGDGAEAGCACGAKS